MTFCEYALPDRGIMEKLALEALNRESGGFVTADRADPDHLQGFIELFDDEIPRSAVVAFCDLTKLPGMYEGFLLTDQNLYGSISEPWSIWLNDVISISAKDTMLYFSYAYGYVMRACAGPYAGQIEELIKAIMGKKRVARSYTGTLQEHLRRQEETAKRAERTAEVVQLPRKPAEPPKKVPEAPPKTIREETPEERRAVQAQDYFEKFLWLIMSVEEKTLDGKDARYYARQAVEYGHPRSFWLKWEVADQWKEHIYEYDALFRAAQHCGQSYADNCNDLQFAAEKLGDPDAMLCFAWVLITGRFGEPKYMQAFKWWKKQLETRQRGMKGCFLQRKVGSLIAQNMDTIQRETDRYREALDMACKSYDIYMKDETVAANQARAFQCLQEAYEWDHDPQITYPLAFLMQYEYGHTYRAAMELLEKSAEGGYEPACERLVKWYLEADHFRRDQPHTVCKPFVMLQRMNPKLGESYRLQAEEIIRSHNLYQSFRIRWPKLREKHLLAEGIPVFAKSRKKWAEGLFAGCAMTFGKYRWTDLDAKKPIPWTVLERRGNQVLLLCDYVIDGHAYSAKQSYSKLHWADSEMRTWLNSKFLREAFSSKEQKMIATVTNDDGCGPDSGPVCQDKVFLLGIDEVKKYFGVRDYYLKKDTLYRCELAKAQTTDHLNDRYVDQLTQCAKWALRSPGTGLGSNAYISGMTELKSTIAGKAYIDQGVRPALWLNLE